MVNLMVTIIHADAIADSFISSYKLWEEGELLDGIFSSLESGALLNTMRTDPSEAMLFYSEVQYHIINKISLERGVDNFLEISKVLAQWNSVLVYFIVPFIHLLSLPESERQSIVDDYNKRLSLSNTERMMSDNVISLSDYMKDDDPIH